MATKDKLTAKQDAFVKAYLLNGGNATQAAIDAGYKEANAAVIGCENLIKPNIMCPKFLFFYKFILFYYSNISLLSFPDSD